MERIFRGRVAALVAAASLLIAASAVGVSAQEFVGEADFSAFSTGTVIHVDALQMGQLEDEEGATRVVNADVAFSAAVADSTGLAGTRSNEMGMLVNPDEPDGMSYARGTGLEVGLGTEVPDGEADGHIAGLAEALAPPTTGPVVEEIGPVPAGPLAYASLARGEAFAWWEADRCPDEDDISRALGYVAHAQLLDAGADDDNGDEENGDEENGGEDDGGLLDGFSEDDEEGTSGETETSAVEGDQAVAQQQEEEDEDESLENPLIATDAPDPERTVSWSLARTALGDQTDAEGNVIGDAHSVIAEQRMTIAPVTFFSGQEGAEFTIEFLGEWVLRATASGIDGGAHVHYGPGEVSPETPVLRIIQDGESELELLTQDLFDEDGLEIPINDGEGTILANIFLGEAPRAIDGEFGSEPEVAADGTFAAAAVDVVRVQVLSEPETGRAGEVRVGHMEVEAAAPVGGILCDVPEEAAAPPLPVTGSGAAMVIVALGLLGAAAVLRGRARTTTG